MLVRDDADRLTDSFDDSFGEDVSRHGVDQLIFNGGRSGVDDQNCGHAGGLSLEVSVNSDKWDLVVRLEWRRTT